MGKLLRWLTVCGLLALSVVGEMSVMLGGLGQFESDRLSELEDRVTILEEEVSDLVGLYTHVWHLEHIASSAGNEANQARNQVGSLESDIGRPEGRLNDLRGQLA